ncbi:hypothetical protein MMC20_005183 [Loxospora ochrophaea]|nr:hypothetical protein [Loxospora ochrophaea]
MALAKAISAAQALGLLERATSSCTASGYSPCNQSGLPADFCCPAQTTCVAFNKGASAICCPTGQTCQNIQPITCDITQQNATLHPSNTLHSTDLTNDLPKCGSECCPQGFTCQNNQCSMNSASSSSAAASTAAKSSSAATSTSPSFSTPVPSSSASQAASSQTPASVAAHCNPFPAPAVLVGFFPGLIAGVLFTILIICCLGPRHNHDSKRDSSLGSVSAHVSDPIYQDQNALRTDFLRRQSKSRNNQTSRVKSLFSRSPSLSPGIAKSVRTPPLRKAPSTESIRIYSPPNERSLRPQTTFSEMMEEAGLRHQGPYLGSPDKVDPRARNASGSGLPR